MRARAGSVHRLVQAPFGDRRGSVQERANRFVDLLGRGGVECGQQIDLEGNLAHRLALGEHQQPEEVEHLARAVKVGFNGLAEDSLELFAVFEERSSVLRLGFEQEALVARVAGQRGVFVAVGHEFERFLAAHPLIAGLQVDLEVLFAARFVDVVVAPVHGHVHAAEFGDRALELREGDDEHVVDRDAEHALDRFGHQLDPADRVGDVDAVHSGRSS